MAVNPDIPVASGLTPHSLVSRVQLFGKKKLSCNQLQSRSLKLAEDKGRMCSPKRRYLSVETQTSSCRICGGKRSTGTDFFSGYFYFFLLVSFHHCYTLVGKYRRYLTLAVDSVLNKILLSLSPLHAVTFQKITDFKYSLLIQLAG